MASTYVKPKGFFKTVLLTGLFVGTTDIIAAHVHQYINTGVFPEKMLYYIAGGALGLENSMQGSFWVALLGLFFHYFISFAFTLLFFLIFPYIKILSYNRYLVGLLYAPFVSLTMKFIVLPLSKLPQTPFVLEKAWIGWIVLGVVLGIPIVASAYKYYGVGDRTYFR
jgi:hypothetical protein